MSSEGKNEILMLTRGKLFMSEGSRVYSLEMPVSVVRDLDVKDRDGLYNLIVNFIQKNKILPSQVFFALAESVCFIKDFAVTSTTDLDKAQALVQEYTDMIPFERVLAKTYKTQTNWRVVGINQDLIDIIFQAFESRGFGLSALFPISVYADLAMSAELTTQKAQVILSKRDVAIKGSMIGAKDERDQAITTSTTASPKNKILPYLLGGFGILLVILIGMLVAGK